MPASHSAGRQWLTWRPWSWRQTLFFRGRGWRRGEWVDPGPPPPRGKAIIGGYVVDLDAYYRR
jgi:hypothetical protein